MGILVIAQTDAAHHIFVVEIVVLLTVGMVHPYVEELVDDLLMTFDGVLAGDAVIIPVENDGIAVPAQQDQGIGQGLEPWLHPGLQGLSRLRIMVVHEGDCHDLMVLDEGTVKDLAHVELAEGAAGNMEVEVQLDIQKIQFVIRILEVTIDLVKALIPVFGDGIEVFPVFGPEHPDQVTDDEVIDVLDCIEAEAVDAGLVDEPPGPVPDLLHHMGMFIIDIVEHQVIKIAILIGDALGPALVDALDHVDRPFAVGCIVVGAGEMDPAPFERGIGIAPPGEGELGPGFDLIGFRDGFGPVIRVHFQDHELLRLIAIGFMV